MKKIIFSITIVILIFFTSIIKSSTKKVDIEIFDLKEDIRLLNEKEPNQIECFGVNENILDLTSADDIASFDQL